MDYIVTGTNILHDGTYYPEGSTISIDEPYASRLTEFLTPVEPQNDTSAEGDSITTTKKGKAK